ncbi:hypothetical protein GM182_07700 [bacterium 3DAC]|nr:hypothetical protein GM182_07700 [bacterium 3DAC]
MNKQRILALITLVLGVFLLIYIPPIQDIAIKDTFYTENNVSFELLGNAHLIYDGVGHKQLTVMGGRYNLTSNYNLFKLFCYGADMTIETQIKPGTIFAVGCNIHFEKPSSVRTSALLIGTKLSGQLKKESINGNIVSYPDMFIYYSLWLFRHPYSFVIGTILLIGGLLVLIKPLDIPERLLHLRGALWGIPVLIGALSLLYIIATVFFVATGLKEGDVETLSVGLYMQIVMAWAMYLLTLFGTYFLLSNRRGYLRYYPIAMGILAPISYGISTLMLLILSLIGFVGVLVLPDLWRSKYLLKDYTRTSKVRIGGK